jgi:hypothetical protein
MNKIKLLELLEKDLKYGLEENGTAFIEKEDVQETYNMSLQEVYNLIIKYSLDTYEGAIVIEQIEDAICFYGDSINLFNNC